MKHATVALIAILVMTTVALAHESLQGPTETIQWDEERYRGDAYPVYGYGATVVDLEVDRATLEVQVRRLTAAVDVGKALNRRLVEGQVAELRNSDGLDHGPQGYYRVIGGKTASLIRTSARLGAMTAGAPDDVVDAIAGIVRSTDSASGRPADEAPDAVSPLYPIMCTKAKESTRSECS